MKANILFRIGIALNLLPFSTWSFAADRLDSTALAGRWTAPCYKSKKFKERYTEDAFEFTGNDKYVRELRNYKDKDCSDAGLIDARTYDGTYKIGNEVKSVQGAREIDFIVLGTFVTAFGEQAVKLATDSKFCNIPDWKRGERRDVTGLACSDEKIDAGTVIFDIVHLADGKLNFGKTSLFRTGASPKDRPKELDTELTFTRVSALGH